MNELELKDIHLPDTSLWWPPAPGWWVLLIFVVLLAIVLPLLLKRLRQRPMRQLALRELERIRQDFNNGLGGVGKLHCASWISGVQRARQEKTRRRDVQHVARAFLTTGSAIRRHSRLSSRCCDEP